MKIKIEVPDGTDSIHMSCFDDSGFLTDDYFVEHESIEIIGEVDTISRKAAIDATWEEPSYKDPLNVLAEMRDRIKALPTAQPEVLKCKDCDWWEKQEASLQGRCGRLGIYPTGEWHCGSARRRQDE